MPPRKNLTFSHQQSIWIVINYGEFKSSNALRMEFWKHFKLSPRQLPHSYVFSRVISRFMASGDVSFQAFMSSPNQKYRWKHQYNKNLVEEEPIFSISLPDLVKPWKDTLLASIMIKSLLLWMIFYQDPKLASNLMKGHLSTNWSPSGKILIVIFLLQIFFPQMSNIRQYK